MKFSNECDHHVNNKNGLFKINSVKYFAVLIIVSLTLLNPVTSDIPTHCLKSQVVGTWTIKRTPLKTKTLSELYKGDALCGHSLPSNEKSSYQAINLDSDDSLTITVTLKDDDSVIVKGDHEDVDLKWTMLYDEGFDIVSSKEDREELVSYFAFLKYAKNSNQNKSITSNWASYCYVSLNGWYHVGDQWGCFRAFKNLDGGSNPDVETNGEAQNKQNVTEDSIAFLEVDTQLNISFNDNLSNPLKMKPKNKFTDRLNSIDNVFGGLKFTEVTSNTIMNTQFNTQFNTKFRERITLHAGFKDHSRVVERINMANLSWTATVYKEFEGKTIEELNELAGKRRDKKNLFLLKKTFNQNTKHTLLKKSKKSQKNLRSSKRTLDMSKYMAPARSQGSCGSCYAAATLSSLEARLRRSTKKKDITISLDHVMNCSVYNQGCDGGYSYLTMKFGFENGFVTKDCYSKTRGCLSTCESNPVEIKDYYYVGGSYGRCDEESMIEELDKNGPFVISFEPSYTFMMYKNGIFEGSPDEKTPSQTKKPEWTKVDHSVVLVGYGEENGLKYWKCQNSWGKSWGEQGFFRIVRGRDYAGIESICEAGIPIIRER